MPIIVNNQHIKTSNFPGGECTFKGNELIEAVLNAGSQIQIIAYLYNSDDIMSLLLIVDAVRRLKQDPKINLQLPYFPYARQDRVCNIGESLSVCVMANIINSLHCERVYLYDPHSDVVGALVNNCDIYKLDLLINSREMDGIYGENIVVISPDAGAEKKTREVAKMLKLPFLCATKIRDTLTGDIVSTEIHGDVNGKNVFIFDDICDGGRTFIELAKVLKEKGANDISLYVTHGIFSQGLDILRPYIKKIYCYHTFLKEADIQHGYLKVFRNKGIETLKNKRPNYAY
jgi:ribose-phosphate pyrophosphokinase